MEENMKWKENDIVSYGEPYKKGLMNREGEILLDKDSNKFTSLIPSRNNTPHLPMVATFNKEGGAIKGVVVINQDGSYNELPFDGSRYYFIDGFDGGLARVNQINEKGEKKWGLIALVMENGVPKIMGVEKEHLVNVDHFSPDYDNVRSFYDEKRKSVPASINGVTKDISLDSLRKKLNSMRKSIIAINEYDFKTFKDSNSHKESINYDAQTMSEVCDVLFEGKLSQLYSNLATGIKINLMARIITNKSENLLMSDLGTFNEQLNKYDYIGELTWGVDIDSEQVSPFRIEVIAGWNDLEVEFSDDGMEVKLKGTDYEAISSVKINGVQYSVGHAKGKTYDFGVIDHTNKCIILPFVFNHIAIGLQTQPLIVSANYQGRWYVFKPKDENFKVENIESETIVDSFRYTLIDGFDHGLARVRINESWGIINVDGKEVLPIEYQNIWNFYGKNRAYTNVGKDGKVEQIWFKDFATDNSMTTFGGTPQERLPYMPKLNSIGMKNFKRFKDRTEIQFKEINFFVGPNNAGKSTSINALILLSYNLKNLHFNSNGLKGVFNMPFDFAPKEYPNLDTNSYFHSANRFGKGLSIKLSVSFGQIDFDVHVDKSSNIEILSIISLRKNLKIVIYNNSAKLCSDNVLLSEYQLKNNRDINSSLRGNELLNTLIDGFAKFTPLSEKTLDDLNVIKSDIQDSVLGANLIHIPVYSASKLAILNRYDNRDLSAVAASFYMDLSDIDKVNAKDFMLKWMDSDHFNIGHDFRIEAIKDRKSLLTIEIKDENDDWVDLCDMGTGSNHLFVLLLYISCIIGKYFRFTHTRPIITIEEPEMNLHPKYQSMLTDMIEDANNYTRNLAKKLFGNRFIFSEEQINTFGFQFAIETHSEYMIRKSQLKVAEKKYPGEEVMLNNNPFKIIYYPQKGNPYDMGWNIYGRFVNFFDEGFFDVASRDAIAISKIERSRR